MKLKLRVNPKGGKDLYFLNEGKEVVFRQIKKG